MTGKKRNTGSDTAADVAKDEVPAAVAFLERLHGQASDWHDLVEIAKVNQEVAQAIYDLRRKHGLTQKALAGLVRTTQPVIARLEDADYEGHSLSMLDRIARALNYKLTVGFAEMVPAVRSSARRVTRRKDGDDSRTAAAKPRVVKKARPNAAVRGARGGVPTPRAARR